MTRGNDSAHPLMPERIGRYEVLLPIASGGMGTVYLAKSRGVGGFEREVAVKVMHHHLREEEGFAHDLIEEAKLAVRIQHPNVVAVLDVGEDPHGVYLVMDYVEGDSLAGLARALRKDDDDIPERLGLRILHDALLGLHAAHELCDKSGEPVGLVHRDFSPQNILVGIDGNSRLTDFGVAKARTRSSHTATGLVKGKIHYMSPEQARSDPIDRRCDVWAAGVIAWELLARRRLYRERSDTAILLQLITEPPVRLRTVKPDVPQALEDAVAHALSTDVGARCPSAKQLASALAHGAASLGGLATSDEVGALVRRISGTRLETRREHVSEVLGLRASLKSIADAATVDTEALTTSAAVGRSKEFEAPHEEREFTEVTKTAGALSVRTPARSSTLWRAMALATAGLLVAIGGGWALAQRQSDHAPAAANTTTTADAPPETPAPSASSVASAAASHSTSTGWVVEARANAPVRSIRVGSRTFPGQDRTSVLMALRFEELGTEVVATSSDGREARVVHVASEGEIALVFPARPAAPHVRPPSPPAPPGKKPAPLAPNPFD
jgi:serine/threonine-protein kinase